MRWYFISGMYPVLYFSYIIPSRYPMNICLQNSWFHNTCLSVCSGIEYPRSESAYSLSKPSLYFYINIFKLWYFSIFGLFKNDGFHYHALIHTESFFSYSPAYHPYIKPQLCFCLPHLSPTVRHITFLPERINPPRKNNDCKYICTYLQIYMV